MFGKSLIVAFFCELFLLGTIASAGELLIGAASADITPKTPVGLDGQFDLRIATKADTPITANAIALESRDANGLGDAAIMVSCDLVGISNLLLDRVREATHKRLPDFDINKLIVNATHTHTAPLARLGAYNYIVPPKAVQVDAYCDFAAERIVAAIEKAWKERTPGSFTWGLGHAAVAENRRAVYADGHATLYGKTNRPDFRGLEGYEDHDVGSLFFWNAQGKLLAITVDVACPAQEVELGTTLNADFWHPVRESLHKKYGKDVCVLGWIGAAGDQSPHLMYRKAAEERMQNLRKLTRLEELARRIVAAVDETFDAVKNDRHANVVLIHKTETLQLPVRQVTEQEYAEPKAAIAEETPDQMRKVWHDKILRRYEEQKRNSQATCGMEIHVLRLGDVAICTNTIELFTDYGVQIKARSPAVQTFVIQLTGGVPHSYLPTERAVRGGGYSAIFQGNPIDVKGGRILVDRTIELIDSLWTKPKQEEK